MKTFVALLLLDDGCLSGPGTPPNFIAHYVLAVIQAEDAVSAARKIGIASAITPAEQEAAGYFGESPYAKYFPFGQAWTFGVFDGEALIAKLPTVDGSDPVAAMRAVNEFRPWNAGTSFMGLIGEVAFLS